MSIEGVVVVVVSDDLVLFAAACCGGSVFGGGPMAVLPGDDLTLCEIGRAHV